MPILNYTTEVDAWKSVSEVQQILAKHGVSHFSVKNEGSLPVALSFTMDYKGQPLNFLLPCNYRGVLNQLKKDKEVNRSKYRTEEQALRIAWRIIKDWVEAQMAIVQSEQVTIEEVFMPYLIINATGETLADRMLRGNGLKLLN